jgi:outer membrane protein OmpA-like peptidoglycan-associated protein
VKPTVEVATPEAPVVAQTPAEVKVVGSTDSIVVTGVLPDKKTQGELIAAVKKAAGKTPVEDETTIGKNIAPIWWGQHFGQLVPQLAAKSPKSYMAHYTADKVIARAEVDGEETKATLAQFVTKVPAAIAAVPEITVVPSAPPAAPQFVEELALLPVYFDTDDSTIRAEEVAKIEKAAAIIKNSKAELGLTVGGYADLRGSAEYNKALSLRRAGAVRDRLIALGVPADKLTVNHYGEDTSKVAKEELWKSRRVVISLTESN